MRYFSFQQITMKMVDHLTTVDSSQLDLKKRERTRELVKIPPRVLGLG